MGCTMAACACNVRRYGGSMFIREERAWFVPGGSIEGTL